MYLLHYRLKFYHFCLLAWQQNGYSLTFAAVHTKGPRKNMQTDLVVPFSFTYTALQLLHLAVELGL